MIFNSERRIFLITQLLTLVLVFINYKIFGFYYDEYEGVFSTFVSGIYTDRIISDYDIDMHFLLLPFYAKMSSFFPSVDVYGIVLLLFSLISIIIFSKVLLIELQSYTALKRSIFVFLSLLIVIPLLLVEVSSTKTAFFSFFSLCLLIFKNEKISKTKILISALFVFFISLIRIDAVVLGSIIVLLSSIIIKKFKWLYILFLLIGSSVYVSHKIVLEFSSEAKNVFYYKELSFFDKSAINTNITDTILNEDIKALKNHFLIDENHFTNEFYDKVLLSYNPFKNDEVYSDVINHFFNVISISLVEFLRIKSLLFLVLFSLVIYLFVNFKGFVKERYLLLFLLFVPFFVGFVVIIPVRFIGPYYLLLLFILVQRVSIFSPNKALLILLTSFMFFVSGLKDVSAKKMIVQKRYELLTNELYRISNENNSPVVFDNIVGFEMFPSKLFYKIPERQSVYFLNYYLFNSYECYIKNWMDLCKCNPLSLNEKLNFIGKNKLPFIMKEDIIGVYINYFEIKYSKTIDFKIISRIRDSNFVYVVVNLE